MAPIEDVNSAANGTDDVDKALQQLRAGRKTPVFLITLANHISHRQDSLSSVLEENEKLHKQVSSLRDENGTIKRALSGAERKISSSDRAQETNYPSLASGHDEREGHRSVIIYGISESTATKPTDRAEDDFRVATNLLDI
ncbi:hypothetical protein Y032_0318g2339 [Ancylostoma ceylanicum]|uniref:Uncharacterized protein n=1 Tax=Ancylostoma ceylanicum TaxID=53326 RepID=A0A016S1W2_9BILA|nr:hypothetical protein Y032_0318g2339 [Ancylostoma ceylanicum]